MKKFLKNIGVFGFILFLLAIGLDLYLTHKLINRNSEGEIIVWKDIYDNGLKEYNHFIYGSSRAWVHIDPSILDEKTGKKYYNLGADGQNFKVQKFRHEELKERTEIKSIIYSVDMFTLGKSEFIYKYEQFIPFMFWKENEVQNLLTPYGYFSFIDYYLPLTRYYGHRTVVSNLLFTKDSTAPSRIRGYAGQERVWNEDLEKAKKNVESLKIKIDENLLSEFELFLKECLNNNIRLVLVYTPEFMAGQKFVSNRNDVINIYRELSKKYNIPFMDFSADSISYNKNFFYNASHLNKEGAEIFTSKLADSLKYIFVN